MEFSTSQILELSSDLLNKSVLSKEQWWEEGALFARDFSLVLRQLPRHAQWMMQELSKHNYALEFRHRDLKESAVLVERGLKFLGLSILLSAIILSICALLPQMTSLYTHHINWPMVVLGVFALMIGYRLFRQR